MIVELLTTQQVADELKVSLKTVYRWIESKRLSAVRLGPRTLRITREKLDRFVSEREDASDGDLTGKEP